MVQIKVFGTGCKLCEQLAEDCRSLAAGMNIPATIEKVTDQDEIFNSGVLLTPGLMLNGKLMVSGKVPMQATLKNWIKRAAENKL